MDSVLGEITLIQIANLGKIKFMSLKVEGEKLVRFVGPNEAGKSTILDRLQNMFESATKLPKGIIRKGLYQEGVDAGRPIDKGMARIETSAGYVIEQLVRTTKAGEQKAELKVTHNGMPVQGGPVGFLKSVSSKYPDPHMVANLSEQELFKELFSILNVDLSSFDEQIEAEKQRATEARAAIKMLGSPKEKPLLECPMPIDELGIDGLRKTRDSLAEKYGEEKAKFDSAKQKLEEHKNNHNVLLESVKRLEKELAEARETATVLTGRIEKGSEWIVNKDNIPDDSELKKVSTTIDSYIDNSSLIQEWEAYKKDVMLRTENNETLDIVKKNVERLQTEKSDKVLTTPVPAKNIYITETGSVMRIEAKDDLHWDTLSMSARLAAATELCINTIPDGALRVIYIERGESIGSDYRKMIADIAAEHNVQVFMEVFSEDSIEGDGVFMLEEGEIVNKIINPPKEMEPKPAFTEKVNPEPTGFGDKKEPKITIGVPSEKVFDLF